MEQFDRDSLQNSALSWLRELVGDLGQPLTFDTDLLEQGIIDSVDFIELVELVEAEAGMTIDLEQVAESELFSIRKLCDHVLGAVPSASAKTAGSAVAESYSNQAHLYQQEESRSCWGRATRELVDGLMATVRPLGTIVDVGCGTGSALAALAANRPEASFIGVEPAEDMRTRAAAATARFGNVRIKPGSFEALPFDAASVDYLYSLYAFHWTSDVGQSIAELARVLKPDGELDLYFTGKGSGREFTRVTTPIYRRYLGSKGLIRSAAMRVHFGREDAQAAFEPSFHDRRLTVSETFQAHLDSLEGHWEWWLARASGHFVGLSDADRSRCEREVREALRSLDGGDGIPYTIHTIHVQVRS